MTSDPLSAFERAQRRWLATDPPVVVDGRRSDLPPFYGDLLDPVVPLPPGVAHDPWLPEVGGEVRLRLALVTIAWFVSVVGLVTALLQDALAVAAVLAVVSSGLAALAWRAWQPPAEEQEAEAALEDGTWREGRHLASSAVLVARGRRVDLVPRHRVLAVRDRPSTAPGATDGRRLELVVDDDGTRRTIPLSAQGLDDLAAVEAWLDDAAWVTAYPAAWTWGVVTVGHLDELAQLLSDRRWPLDAGFRMGEDWLVHDVPVDGEDVWAVLGTGADGAVRALVEVRIPPGEADDPSAVAARLRDALERRRELSVDAVAGEDLRPRLESPEQHGVTTLALTHAAREVREAGGAGATGGGGGA